MIVIRWNATDRLIDWLTWIHVSLSLSIWYTGRHPDSEDDVACQRSCSWTSCIIVAWHIRSKVRLLCDRKVLFFFVGRGMSSLIHVYFIASAVQFIHNRMDHSFLKCSCHPHVFTESPTHRLHPTRHTLTRTQHPPTPRNTTKRRHWHHGTRLLLIEKESKRSLVKELHNGTSSFCSQHKKGGRMRRSILVSMYELLWYSIGGICRSIEKHAHTTQLFSCTDDTHCAVHLFWSFRVYVFPLFPRLFVCFLFVCLAYYSLPNLPWFGTFCFVFCFVRCFLRGRCPGVVVSICCCSLRPLNLHLSGGKHLYGIWLYGMAVRAEISIQCCDDYIYIIVKNKSTTSRDIYFALFSCF